MGSLSRIGQWMSAVAHNSAPISLCAKILFEVLGLDLQDDNSRAALIERGIERRLWRFSSGTNDPRTV